MLTCSVRSELPTFSARTKAVRPGRSTLLTLRATCGTEGYSIRYARSEPRQDRPPNARVDLPGRCTRGGGHRGHYGKVAPTITLRGLGILRLYCSYRRLLPRFSTRRNVVRPFPNA